MFIVIEVAKTVEITKTMSDYEDSEDIGAQALKSLGENALKIRDTIRDIISQHIHHLGSMPNFHLRIFSTDIPSEDSKIVCAIFTSVLKSIQHIQFTTVTISDVPFRYGTNIQLEKSLREQIIQDIKDGKPIEEIFELSPPTIKSAEKQ